MDTLLGKNKPGKNKPHCYVCLYFRQAREIKMPGGEDKYHWALVVEPKDPIVYELNHPNAPKEATRYHARDTMVDQIWRYEKKPINTGNTLFLLARLYIGKVASMPRFEEILDSVPVRGNSSQPGYVEGWNCIAWVEEALQMLEKDGEAMSKGSVLDWEKVRQLAMWYITKKVEEGRWKSPLPEKLKAVVPTWDATKGKEITP